MKSILSSLITACTFLLLLPGCTAQGESPATPVAPSDVDTLSVSKTEDEWKEELPHMACFVLREKGTERAFTGQFWDHHVKGTYRCAGCGLDLFDSQHKFESGTGWPSFFQPAEGSAVLEKEEDSWGMRRVEVLCSSCGGHLGHVFEDGPRPTGLRYCINSAALTFAADTTGTSRTSEQSVKYD